MMMRHWRLRALGATLVAVAMVMGGCGSPDGSQQQTVDDGDVPAPDSTVPPDPVTRPVGKAGWWGGFRITVDEATAEVPADAWTYTAQVTLAVTMENLGEESTAPPFEVRLEAGGVSFDAFTDSPTIGGGGNAPATVTADVDPSGLGVVDDRDLGQVLDALTVVYGEASENQTKIPLGPDPVETFEPQQLAVEGGATHGPLTVTVTGGSLRPSYKRGENGKYELALDFELACDGCARIGINVSRGGFVLTSPAGASVTPDSRSPYCCDALYSNDRKDDADQTVVFLVTEPLTGAYQLTMTADRGVKDEHTPKPLDFQL
jgi:hypothetical protein